MKKNMNVNKDKKGRVGNSYLSKDIQTVNPLKKVFKRLMMFLKIG